MCPFVDRGYVRCSAHMTLQNLMSAFTDCVDNFHACPIYQEIASLERESDPVDVPLGVVASA